MTFGTSRLRSRRLPKANTCGDQQKHRKLGPLENCNGRLVNFCIQDIYIKHHSDLSPRSLYSYNADAFFSTSRISSTSDFADRGLEVPCACWTADGCPPHGPPSKYVPPR